MTGSVWSRRWELAFALLSVAAVVPLWSTHYLPVQDLPQHLAAIRVLHSHDDPYFGLQPFFELHLMRTQYLAYYLCADLLSYVAGVDVANRLLMSVAVIGLPLSLRALLAALGRDERPALLAFGLTYNAHLILGFLNFIAALPLCVYGLSLAVRLRRAPRRRTSIALGVVTLVCFYMHVVPFALLLLGCGLCALTASLRVTVARLLPLWPGLVAAIFWSVRSPAGQATVGAVGVGEGGPSGARVKATFWNAQTAFAQAPAWLTDVLQGPEDGTALTAWAALWTLWLAAGLVSVLLRARARSGGERPDGFSRDLSLRLGALVPLCLCAYVWLPTDYGWIWPIAPRFILVAALLSILLLPRATARAQSALAVLALLLGLWHVALAGRAWAAFDRDEVGDLDEALGKIPPGQRVAGLIFDRGSRNVRFSPFIHYVAYYQARRGGAVMFTFADFAHSPFSFRAGNRPPRVPPRWEWMPQRVRPERDLGWYDYVLVRGGPGRIAGARGHFSNVHRGARWSVWQRLR